MLRSAGYVVRWIPKLWRSSYALPESGTTSSWLRGSIVDATHVSASSSETTLQVEAVRTATEETLRGLMRGESHPSLVGAELSSSEERYHFEGQLRPRDFVEVALFMIVIEAQLCTCRYSTCSPLRLQIYSFLVRGQIDGSP